MYQREFQVKPNDVVAKCPKCGNNTEFTGRSDQFGVDICAVWAVCKCGYDPTAEKTSHRMESAMGGVDADNMLWALEVWSDMINDVWESGVAENDKIKDSL